MHIPSQLLDYFFRKRTTQCLNIYLQQADFRRTWRPYYLSREDAHRLLSGRFLFFKGRFVLCYQPSSGVFPSSVSLGSIYTPPPHRVKSATPDFDDSTQNGKLIPPAMEILTVIYVKKKANLQDKNMILIFNQNW